MKNVRFKRLDGSQIDVDLSDAKHQIVSGQIEPWVSVLQSLTPNEWKHLQEWTAHERKGKGTVNLQSWPGWSDVLRRFDTEVKAGHKEAKRLVAELLAQLQNG